MKQTQQAATAPEMTTRQRIKQTLLLLALALVSITAASYAWFSISDSTRLHSMNLDITTGASLRFDLNAHTVFEDYVKSLGFDEIAAQMADTFGFDVKENKMEPVTTTDVERFTLEDGAEATAQEGQYLEFTLHFMATQDMEVHLTSANSDAGEDGTLVEGLDGADQLVQAMRIGFVSDDGAKIYQPVGSSNGTFTLARAEDMQYNNENTLFSLLEGVDKTVTVRIWLEGTDEACTDELRGSDFRLRLRFQGTDAQGQTIE